LLADVVTGDFSQIVPNSSNPVITGQPGIYALAADDTTLYWLSPANSSYELRSAPKGGGAVKTLYTGGPIVYGPYGLLVHGAYLYWADNNKIMKMAK
jgi:hypothetical protein